MTKTANARELKATPSRSHRRSSPPTLPVSASKWPRRSELGADRIHIDVMDGHFVPNISMGAPIVASLRRVTRLPLETHLMISDPDLFLDEFVDAGSDSFLVHWEGNANLHRTVENVSRLSANALASRLILRLRRAYWKRSCQTLTRCWS